MSNNPYLPPQANLDVAVNGEVSPALWNPGAAAGWSLLFSPVFGALVHMKNWEALGKPEEAARSKNWAIGSGVVLVVAILSGIVMPESKALDMLGRFGGFALLIAWYAANGKDQIAFVAYGYGKDYERRAWGMPLLYALLGIVALVVCTIIIALAMGALGAAEG